MKFEVVEEDDNGFKMKLALGTVQFGLDYGVTNHSGQVARDEVKDILDYANTNNIDTLDTAARYGNSEQILGEVGVNNFRIITKTTPLKNGVDRVIKDFHHFIDVTIVFFHIVNRSICRSDNFFR